MHDTLIVHEDGNGNKKTTCDENRMLNIPPFAVSVVFSVVAAEHQN